MIDDIYTEYRDGVAENQGNEWSLVILVAKGHPRFTLGNLTSRGVQPKPSTTTGDQASTTKERLPQVPTTEQREFRLARSRLKG
jgi:hypothetical protein